MGNTARAMPGIRGKWVPFWVNVWVCAGKSCQSAGLVWLWLSVRRVHCWGAGLRFDGVPGYVAGGPGHCLRVCWDVLPGSRVTVWGFAGVLPGCWVEIWVAAACRKAGWTVPGGCQEQLGTRGNPQIRTGPGTSTRLRTEKLSLLLKILSLLLSFFPNWYASDIICIPFSASNRLFRPSQ